MNYSSPQDIINVIVKPEYLKYYDDWLQTANEKEARGLQLIGAVYKHKGRKKFSYHFYEKGQTTLRHAPDPHLIIGPRLQKGRGNVPQEANHYLLRLRVRLPPSPTQTLEQYIQVQKMLRNGLQQAPN